MNKFSEKIHFQFVNGSINTAVYNYMSKLASSIEPGDTTIFDSHIKTLTQLKAGSEVECELYFKIFSTINKYLQFTGIKTSSSIKNNAINYIFANRGLYNFNNSHNLIKACLDFKKAYPNNMGIEGELTITPPYNIDKWIETMRDIYHAVSSKGITLDDATAKNTIEWDSKEKSHFIRWMKYYQEGNYNKYNVKTAQFFQKQQEQASPDLNGVKSLFSAPKPEDDKKVRLDDARKKLRGRLKAVEELVEQYRDVLPREVSAIIRKDVYELKEKIHGLELRASIVDSINRTSNQLTKHGFVEGAFELRKIAQEVAENKLPELIPEGPVEMPAPNAELEPVELVEPEKKPAKKPEVKPFTLPDAEKDVENNGAVGNDEDMRNVHLETIAIPNFTTATHGDALRKLEEINEVLSKRSLVRALAYCDIILGNLGIASYFPALSESQSKLLDAFNYSATRISDVISQLRGGIAGKEDVLKSEEPSNVVEVKEDFDKPVGEITNSVPK